MIRPVFAVLVCFFIIISTELQAAEKMFRGFLDTYHGVRLSSPNDFLSSRTRARLETQISQDRGLAFVSLNAVHNNVIESETGIDFREAYIEYAADWFDVRIGRQIVVWGQAEGFQVTDIISPRDYTEYLARDFDEMRLPVDACKVRLLGESFTFGVVFIPVFTPAVVPFKQKGVSGEWDNNPWAQELPEGVTINDTEEPDLKIQNSEVAGKLTYNSSIADFSLMAFYTWDDIAAMHSDGSSITPRYHRLTVFGFEFAVPVSDFVLRGESVFNKGKYLNSEHGNPLRKNSVVDLLGIDWSPGNDWTVSVQCYHVYILDYETELEDDENTVYSTLTVSKELLRNTLTLSTMLFFGIKHHDLYNRTSADYALNDEINITAGVDWFWGNQGMFGPYEDNSEVFLKVKYGF